MALADYVPSLTFQLAMFPSVIVGDIAGIVKFWPARILEQLRSPTKRISKSVMMLGEADVLWDFPTDLCSKHDCGMTDLSLERFLYLPCTATP